MPGFWAFWKQKARELKLQTYALYFAYRDPRVPWYAKGFILLVVAYAFSPIDLIPDFIPLLGYLDDLVLIPLGVWLALRMIPSEVMAENRAKAAEQLGSGKPVFRSMGVVIITIWIMAVFLVVFLVYGAIRR